MGKNDMENRTGICVGGPDDGKFITHWANEITVMTFDQIESTERGVPRIREYKYEFKPEQKVWLWNGPRFARRME